MSVDLDGSFFDGYVLIEVTHQMSPISGRAWLSRLKTKESENWSCPVMTSVDISTQELRDRSESREDKASQNATRHFQRLGVHGIGRHDLVDGESTFIACEMREAMNEGFAHFCLRVIRAPKKTSLPHRPSPRSVKSFIPCCRSELTPFDG